MPIMASGMLRNMAQQSYALFLLAIFFVSYVSFYAQTVLCRILGVFFRDLLKS